MTKKTPKPTPAHMQKLADLMDTRPEGVTVQRVRDTLQVSPTLAKAALIEIGATEVDGKWVFEPEQDDATLEEIGNFVSQPQLKKLTQAVFDGLPSEYRWAAVDGNGEAHLYNRAPQISEVNCVFGYFKNFTKGCDYLDLGEGFDATDWQNSLIEREEVAEPVCTTCETKTDLAPLSLTGECQQCYEDAVDKAWWDTQGGMFKPAKPEPVCTKSDFAVALEAERQRVYDAVAIGGTVERLAELTGLHVDDVQQHLDALIVDGAIYQKPIVIAMSYGVMG